MSRFLHKLRLFFGRHGPSVALTGKCGYCRKQWDDFGKELRKGLETMNNVEIGATQSAMDVRTGTGKLIAHYDAGEDIVFNASDYIRITGCTCKKEAK